LRAGADIVEILPRIRRFAELLLEWNRGFSNLISTSDENRLVQRHILESLEPAHWIKSSGARRWLDFGSGGGLPALPLALAGIGENWTLVESRRNKTLFLRKVIQEFELKNINVELARLESLPEEAERLGKFDGFTSRATLRLGPTLALAADWVAPGGLAYLWKGSRMEQEMVEDRRWATSWERDDVFAIVRGVNDHFHDMVERPDGRQLFDDLRAEDFRLLAYRSGHADFRTERRALESILKPIPHRVDPEDRRSLRRRPIGGHYHYCEACRASGRIDGGRCPSCDGNGGVYETRSDLPCRERM